MDTVTSAAKSDAAAYEKGFNIEASSVATSEISSSQPVVSNLESSVAVSAATAVVTETSSMAASQVGSAVETEAGSAASSAPSSAAIPGDASYKQKWKSLDGIVKKDQKKISELTSVNVSLLASHQAPAASAQASSVAASAVDELVALYEQHADAIIEGNKKDAARLQMQIDSIKEARFNANVGRQVETVATAALTAREDDVAFSSVVSNTWRDLPYLDHNSEDANARAIQLVQVVAAEYVTRENLPRSQALAMAVSEVAEIFGSSAVTAAESSMAASPELSANESTLKGMAPVKQKGGPVKTEQKAKGEGSFETGFASVANTLK